MNCLLLIQYLWIARVEQREQKSHDNTPSNALQKKWFCYSLCWRGFSSLLQKVYNKISRVPNRMALCFPSRFVLGPMFHNMRHSHSALHTPLLAYRHWSFQYRTFVHVVGKCRKSTTSYRYKIRSESTWTILLFYRNPTFLRGLDGNGNTLITRWGLDYEQKEVPSTSVPDQYLFIDTTSYPLLSHRTLPVSLFSTQRQQLFFYAASGVFACVLCYSFRYTWEPRHRVSVHK